MREYGKSAGAVDGRRLTVHGERSAVNGPGLTECMLSLREVSVRLGVHVDTVRRLARLDRIRVVKIGGSVRVKESEVRKIQDQGVAL